MTETLESKLLREFVTWLGDHEPPMCIAGPVMDRLLGAHRLVELHTDDVPEVIFGFLTRDAQGGVS